MTAALALFGVAVIAVLAYAWGYEDARADAAKDREKEETQGDAA